MMTEERATHLRDARAEKGEGARALPEARALMLPLTRSSVEAGSGGRRKGNELTVIVAHARFITLGTLCISEWPSMLRNENFKHSGEKRERVKVSCQRQRVQGSVRNSYAIDTGVKKGGRWTG